MRTEEGTIKDKVKAFLIERDAWYNMPVPSGYGTPTLDFIGCYKGRFFSIETKAPGREPTARQNYTMDRMRRAGACVIWGDSAEKIIALLGVWFTTVDRACEL